MSIEPPWRWALIVASVCRLIVIAFHRFGWNRFVADGSFIDLHQIPCWQWQVEITITSCSTCPSMTSGLLLVMSRHPRVWSKKNRLEAKNHPSFRWQPFCARKNGCWFGVSDVWVQPCYEVVRKVSRVISWACDSRALSRCCEPKKSKNDFQVEKNSFDSSTKDWFC